VARRHRRLLGAPQLAPWLPLLPLGVWLAGAVAAWTAWNNRQRRYAANAQGRVVQSLGVSLLQVAAGWSGLAAGGLILSQLAGQAIALLTLARADVAARLPWLRGHDRAALLAEVRRYREFPLVNTPHAFVVAFQDSLMLALLSALSGAAIVGQYALVLRVLKTAGGWWGRRWRRWCSRPRRWRPAARAVLPARAVLVLAARRCAVRRAGVVGGRCSRWFGAPPAPARLRPTCAVLRRRSSSARPSWCRW
jgi:hypothetical protein